MKVLTFYTGAISAIMLSYTANAQDNSANPNLHRTVTHDNTPSVRVPLKQDQKQAANHTLAKENVMPNGDKVPDLGYWTGQVTIFRDYLERQLPDADRRFGEGSHRIPFSQDVKHDGIYDYKKLTKDDYYALATSYNGVGEFEMICGIKDAAGAEGPNGKLTQKDIDDAQAALEYLKPEGCKSWKSFGNWLIKIEGETETQRAALHDRHKQKAGSSGALIDLHKNDNIAGDPMEMLNQQKALQLLEQYNVQIDSDHSLKTPDPKAVALEAVKNLKGAVRTS